MTGENMLKRFVLGFIALLFCLTSNSFAQEKDHNTLVEELIVKSGLRNQIGQLPEIIKISLIEKLQKDSVMSSEYKENFKENAMKAFDAQEMIKTAKDDIASKLTDEELNTLLQWLNSPIGEKITKLEEDSSTPEGYSKLKEFKTGLKDAKPDENRLVLLEKFDQAARMTETSVKNRVNINVAIASSMAAAMGNPDFSSERYRAYLEKYKPQFTQSSKNEIKSAMLFTYQKLTDDEIQKYIDFLNTSKGQKYTNVISEAIIKSIRDAASRLGRGMGEYIRQTQQKGKALVNP